MFNIPTYDIQAKWGLGEMAVVTLLISLHNEVNILRRSYDDFVDSLRCDDNIFNTIRINVDDLSDLETMVSRFFILEVERRFGHMSRANSSESNWYRAVLGIDTTIKVCDEAHMSTIFTRIIEDCTMPLMGITSYIDQFVKGFKLLSITRKTCDVIEISLYENDFRGSN